MAAAGRGVPHTRLEWTCAGCKRRRWAGTAEAQLHSTTHSAAQATIPSSHRQRACLEKHGHPAAPPDEEASHQGVQHQHPGHGNGDPCAGGAQCRRPGEGQVVWALQGVAGGGLLRGGCRTAWVGAPGTKALTEEGVPQALEAGALAAQRVLQGGHNALHLLRQGRRHNQHACGAAPTHQVGCKHASASKGGYGCSA